MSILKTLGEEQKHAAFLPGSISTYLGDLMATKPLQSLIVTVWESSKSERSWVWAMLTKWRYKGFCFASFQEKQTKHSDKFWTCF